MRSARTGWGVALAIFTLVLWNAPVNGAEQLVVAGWGGLYEPNLRKAFIPEFESKFNVKVVWVNGTSFEHYGKIKAQRSNPQIDIALLDEPVLAPARKEGLIAPLDPKIVTHLADMKKIALIENNEGVGFSYFFSGIVYNEKIFKEKGFPAPTSWNDLFRPEYKGRVVLRHITSGYGLYPMIMLAKMNGGSEANIEPGFKKMRELAPSVIEFATSNSAMGQLMLREDAWIGVSGPPEVKELMRRGAPLRLVVPKEGTIPIVETISVVKGAPHAKLAQEFVNATLSPRGQAQWTIATSLAPLNTKVPIDDQLREALPYDPAETFKVETIDFDLVAKNRPAWTERWNKEIASR